MQPLARPGMAPVMHLFLTQLRSRRLFPAMANVAQALLEGRPSVEAEVAS